MLRFVERQTVFVLETTADVKIYHDFLTNMSGMVLLAQSENLGDCVKILTFA